MDFKGETLAEASDELVRFAVELAGNTGSPIERGWNGILGRKRSVSCERFFLAVRFDTDLRVKLKLKLNSCPRRFGRGRFVCGSTAAVLELRADEEGMVRWHRLPARVKGGCRVAALRDPHWFPLTSDYILDALSASAAEEATLRSRSSVLVMK